MGPGIQKLFLALRGNTNAVCRRLRPLAVTPLILMANCASTNEKPAMAGFADAIETVTPSDKELINSLIMALKEGERSTPTVACDQPTKPRDQVAANHPPGVSDWDSLFNAITVKIKHKNFGVLEIYTAFLTEGVVDRVVLKLYGPDPSQTYLRAEWKLTGGQFVMEGVPTLVSVSWVRFLDDKTAAEINSLLSGISTDAMRDLILNCPSIEKGLKSARANSVLKNG